MKHTYEVEIFLSKLSAVSYWFYVWIGVIFLMS